MHALGLGDLDSQHAVSKRAGDAVERLPFSVEKAVSTPYRHDAFQPRYLVSETLDRTIAEILGLTPKRLLEQ